MAVNEMNTQYVKTYESNLIHLVEQKASKLRGTVMVRGMESSDHQFNVVDTHDTLNSPVYGTNAAKWVDTVITDTVFNNRVVTPVPVYTADTFKRFDASRTLIDPQSALIKGQASRLGRKIDKIIIAAATGTATDSLGTGSLTLPATQQIGGAAIAPSFTLVQQTRETILESEIADDEEVFFVVTPNFVAALMTDAKATSVDYANGRMLMSGTIVQGWMGFTWIVSNLLTTAGGAGPYQKYALAYTADAIGMKINQDIQTKVAEVPQKQFDTLVYSSLDCGAVRVQDKKVFRIHYLETN
jgi:hypothetical protein